MFATDSDVGEDVEVNDGVADEGGVLCGEEGPSRTLPEEGLLSVSDDGCWGVDAAVELGVAGDG